MIEILNENEETEIIGGTIPVQAFATNIEVNPGISSYISETDPIFKASAAYNITNSDIISWNNKASEGYVDTKLMTKQDTLVSGTNIKTINNESILGSGNIEIEAPEYTAGAGIYIDNQNEISAKLGQGLFIDDNAAIRLNNDTLNKLDSIATKQDILVSGTNIKTINNNSLLGSGNLEIGGGIDPTDLLTYIYPVGSIYMSVNNVSPQTFLGGTWERIKDKFLLGAGDTYNAGATGGEATHTLTEQEMPSHSHKITLRNAGNPNYYQPYPSWTAGGATTDAPIQSTGGSQPHNNMPPYLSVYMWKRTA